MCPHFSLLWTKNVRLQWHLAWTLAQLAEDEEVSAEMGQLGAIPVILSELGWVDLFEKSWKPRLNPSGFSDICESKNRNLDDWLTMLTGEIGVCLVCILSTDFSHYCTWNRHRYARTGYLLCFFVLKFLEYKLFSQNKVDLKMEIAGSCIAVTLLFYKYLHTST